MPRVDESSDILIVRFVLQKFMERDGGKFEHFFSSFVSLSTIIFIRVVFPACRGPIMREISFYNHTYNLVREFFKSSYFFIGFMWIAIILHSDSLVKFIQKIPIRFRHFWLKEYQKRG